MPADIAVDILAVDDNANNLRSLEALLRDIPVNLIQATSGEDALRQLLTRDFALILLDVQMPNLDGYETAKLIRARERTRHVPIIFLTALNRAEVNVVRGYALGAVDFLFKPLVPEILRSKVGVFLELHRKTQQMQRQQALLTDAQRREAERKLLETRQQYERSLLKEEMERERKVKEALGQRAEELTRVVEEKARAEKRLELLADTASRLLLSPGGAQQDVYRRLCEHLGLEVHFEYHVDGANALRLVSHSGLEPGSLERMERMAFGQGISGTAAAVRSRIVSEDIQRTTEIRDEVARGMGLAAVACFPLVAHGRLLGTVAVGTRRARTFTPEEIALMQGVCDQVAVSLERDRLIEELRERDRRKDEFLAMLAHELRNPMAPIRSAIDVLRYGLPDEPRLARALDSADRQVTHMSRLVDDLLDVSRITRGKVELRRQKIQLAQVVDQAIAANEPILRERRHTLSVSMPTEPITLVADATRLAQVVANLVHNAAKYTDPGGEIRVVGEVQGGDAVLRVRDNGIGISTEMLPKVFEIFVQVEPTSDRASGGLGLGLTLVKSLVELHQGQVEAISEGTGKGSEFIIRLPLPHDTRDALPAARGAERTGASKVPPLSILLVEDNPDIRTTMRDLLELHGHTVEEADDGETGVELAFAHHPNVMLVDIGLPGLDGYGVAERIRATVPPANGDGQPRNRPRLVALTGYGTPEATQKALAAGFDAHLVKPVSFADLSQVLRKLTSNA